VEPAGEQLHNRMQNTHVCSDAQAGGRVAEIAGMVNIVGANVGSNSDKFISVLNLFYKY
jgi:hypothetical protein